MHMHVIDQDVPANMNSCMICIKLTKSIHQVISAKENICTTAQNYKKMT